MNQCVEVASGPGWTAIRDSKDPDGPALLVNPASFAAFTRKLRDGHLDA